ncbi:L-aminopeptidase/D-esterase-like protein [Phreatobacter oligotrophus]|jgi:L-aminopeptidase/D-esterase-like protein|uniref:L-aminopeptidase/D-esterase-like protein n=2 Tax=Phreatobacter oligotrophus TaxID=1122261 RepID=A0A2T4YZF7_9HYPH|nr:L-aminopeptidase/D-esterase-like protein [Phreatobacter oligotrophus]
MSMASNTITDIPGLKVGHATDLARATGTTAIIFDEPAVCAVDVRGGAPGSRDTELLRPDKTVQTVDAVVLSGGSAFGLDAPGGVSAWLAENGRGFAIGPMRVPIVPGAIVFDLLSGGDKAWGRFSPYRDLGYAAAAAATADPVALGTIGAGTGATTADLKGGIGSASAISPSGHRVGAIVVVNAVGSATIGSSGHFWAATDEVGDEFGGGGLPHPFPADAHALKLKGARPENTTIALVVTDAVLDKGQATHLAVMAQDGLGRAIRPIHTPLDGDTVFAAATGAVPVADYARDMAAIGFTAASVLARACARGVHAATALPFPGALPAWKDRFG